MTTNVIFLICSFNIWINNLELILCFNWLVYMSFIDRHTGLVYEIMEYYGITKEELHEKAFDNMRRKDPPKIENIMEKLQKL